MADVLRSGPRAAIAIRELSSLKREKTIVLALLIQLFVATFSSFLVVGLTSLYDPSSIGGGGEVPVGVSGELQDELVEAAADHESLTTVRYQDRAGAVAAFDDGDVYAVLHATETRTAAGTQVEVQAIAPAGNLRTTLVVVQLRRALTTLETDVRADRTAHLEFVPLDVPERVPASPYFGFTYTVLVPLLVFLPPFISGSIAVDSITEEIERGTLDLLRVAPVSLVDIVDGKAVGMILLAPAQVALWIGLLVFNGIRVGNPLALLVYVTAVATVVVSLGLLLGLLTRSRRRAQLLYSTLVLVLFGLATALPEHPATTVAKLSIASETSLTLAHVGLFVAVAIVGLIGTRQLAARLNPETL